MLQLTGMEYKERGNNDSDHTNGPIKHIDESHNQPLLPGDQSVVSIERGTVLQSAT